MFFHVCSSIALNQIVSTTSTRLVQFHPLPFRTRHSETHHAWIIQPVHIKSSHAQSNRILFAESKRIMIFKVPDDDDDDYDDGDGDIVFPFSDPLWSLSSSKRGNGNENVWKSDFPVWIWDSSTIVGIILNGICVFTRPASFRSHLASRKGSCFARWKFR